MKKNAALPSRSAFSLGSIRVFPDRNTLTCGDDQLTIEPRVMSVLCLLAEQPGEVVTRDSLIERIWGSDHGGDDSVNRAISILRKSLNEIDGSADYIQTIPKRGYRLRGSVASLVETTPEAPVDVPAAGGQRGRIGTLIGATAIAIVASVFFLNRDEVYRTPELPAATPSIAVLPFDVISSKSDDELLGASVHDALLSSLQKIRSLRVISRTSSLQYEQSSLRSPQIAKELGVTWLVEGTLTRESDLVRIGATLIDGRDDTTVWAQQYERPLDASAMFEIQASISRNIARELSSVLMPAGAIADRGAPTKNMEAYRAYMLGKRRVQDRTSDSLAAGVEKLREAIELDPQFAEAYAELAMAYSLQGSYANLTRMEITDLAMPLAQRALDMAPGLAQAHTALADLRGLAGDWKGAEESYQQAIRLNPSYARARQWYAIGLMEAGRVVEALEEHRAARDLDPLSVMMTLNVAQDLLFLGRVDEALAEYEYALEVDPEFAATYGHLAHINRTALKRHDVAIKWLLDAHAADPRHTEFPSQLAATYLELDLPELALDWVECALTLGATQYWPNRAGLLVALYNDDVEGVLRHATLINERQPDALLPLSVLRDHALGQNDVAGALALFRRGFPDLLNERPEVTEYNYPAALALAYFFRQAGQSAQANELLKAVLPFTKNHTRTLEMGADLTDIELLAMLGRNDEALSLLEEAVAGTWRRHWWRLRNNPQVDALRDDPRFDLILANLGQGIRPLQGTVPKDRPQSCGSPQLSENR